MNIPQGYKQTEFGPIPLEWKLCTFKDVLATFSSGATPYRGIPEYYNGDVRWISSGELRRIGHYAGYKQVCIVQ